MLRSACLLIALGFGIAGAAQQGASRPAPKPKPGVATPGVKIPIAKLEPIATFDIPGAPDWMAADEFLWVSNAPKNNVTRIDPKTNRFVKSISTGARPCAGADRRVWIVVGAQLRRQDRGTRRSEDGESQRDVADDNRQ